MATIEIESTFIGESSSSQAGNHALRMLENLDNMINKAVDLFTSYMLFKKEPYVEHHLNLLVEDGENESACKPKHNMLDRSLEANSGTKSTFIKSQKVVTAVGVFEEQYSK